MTEREGERESERETRRETSISSRAEIANGVDVALPSSSALSPHRPIYLSIASSASVPNKKKEEQCPHCKSQRGAHLTSSFCHRPSLPSSSFVPFGAILIPLTKSP